MKKLATLPHLPAFEAAARRSSFRLAADELCITTSAVSRHIRALENQLGVQLFYRAHKAVKLTEAGYLFSVVATRLLNELVQIEKSLSHHVPSESITVQCLPTFAMHWLMPRLSRLNEMYPELNVNVTTGTGPVKLNEAFDIAIRRDKAHFSGLNADSFLTEYSVLVCNKHYLRTHPVSSPENLDGHVKICIRAREDLWKSWIAKFDRENNYDNRTVTLDHTFAAIQAAEDGLGLAVIPELFCEKHLHSGRLVSPFPNEKVYTGEYYILWKQRHDESLMKFSDWLRSSL